MEELNSNKLVNPDGEDQTSLVVASFKQSFEKSNLVDTFSQVGEFAIDQAIKNELLRDVPVFGVLVSGYKTVVNVKEFALTRKIYRFMFNLRDTTPEQRQEFARKYCEKNKENTALALLDIIEKLNNGHTVPVVCNLMKAVINEEITIAQFNRLVVALQRTSYTDLIQLEKYENEYDEDGLSDALQAAGLIYQSTYDAGSYDSGENNCKFQLSPNGFLMLRYGFNMKDVYEGPRFTEVNAGLTLETYEGERTDDDREMFEYDQIRGK